VVFQWCRELQLPMALVDATRAPELYDKVVDILGAVLGVNSLPARCGAVLLELLLEAVVETTNWGREVELGPRVGQLISELLWSQAHWDSPPGRLMLRRLEQAFFTYAKFEAMPQAAFLRFCEDAGLHRVRGPGSGAATYFADAFQEVAPRGASFEDFVGLVERCATWAGGDGAAWQTISQIKTEHLRPAQPRFSHAARISPPAS